MKVSDIEIPYEENRGPLYRFLEMSPAIMSYSLVLLPVILSIYNTVWAAYFLVAYVLIWFFKAIAMSYRVLQGHQRMNIARVLDWEEYLADIEKPEAAIERLEGDTDKWSKIHRQNLLTYTKQTNQSRLLPSQVVHVSMIAVYNESIDVVEPTIQSVVDSIGNHADQMVLVIAYEERGGAEVEAMVKKLIRKYRHFFRYTTAIKHPDGMEGEVIGKGGNITYAGRKLQKWLDKESIDYERVLVTTLDSDNRPDPSYYAALSYSYIISNDRIYKSFQPIPLYFTNIWDVPAPMRIIATGNSLWMLVTVMRQHLLRNFSAHAQPMAGLVKTDFWSVRTIVEDGHQYWRSYFKFDGRYDVLPIYVPIHQDAVLAATYRKTLKAQFIQLRRWAYGASDIAYVAHTGFFLKNKMPRVDLVLKLGRLIESHVSWATAAVMVAAAGWIPLFFNPDSNTNLVALQLPDLVATLQRVATVGIFITMYIGIVSLPPRPARVGRHISVAMYVQWLLLPLTTILYNTFAAIYSQTRLFLGLYLDKFDVTEKAVKK